MGTRRTKDRAPRAASRWCPLVLLVLVTAMIGAEPQPLTTVPTPMPVARHKNDVFDVATAFVAPTPSPRSDEESETASATPASKTDSQLAPAPVLNDRVSRDPLGVEFAPTKTVTPQPPTADPEPTWTMPSESQRSPMETEPVITLPPPPVASTEQHQDELGLTVESDGSLEYHRREVQRLTALRSEFNKKLLQQQARLRELEEKIQRESDLLEADHALNLHALPSPRQRTRNLACMGWKKASQCRWSGRRKPDQDESCFTPVHGGSAGFCEVQDEDTGEFFRVMHTNCSTMPETTQFWCQLAPSFANFPAEIEHALANEDSTVPATDNSQGIIMIIKSSQLPEVYVSLRQLQSLGCTLPVELWYFTHEMVAGSRAKLDALVQSLRGTMSIIVRAMDKQGSSYQGRAFGKVHALTHSAFARVLLLAPGVLALRDPTYLFADEAFVKTGAVIWPDLFHPMTTQSNLHPASLLWEYLDLAPVESFEQDPRQLLLDRRRTARALRVLELFATHRPNLLERLRLVEGDKDHVRLALLRSGTPFVMVPVPPALGGDVLGGVDGGFCGAFVVQHDHQGRRLFIHRQPRAPGDVGLTHLQAFDWLDATGRNPLVDLEMRYHYVIQVTPRDRDSVCVRADPRATPGRRFMTREWPEATVIKHVEAFAVEAVDVLAGAAATE